MQRHPHPHIDPRQPRANTCPGTNPPVFAWKPESCTPPYRLVVAKDANLQDTVLDIGGLGDPVFLPETALEPGIYHWRWEADSQAGQTLQFTISPDSVIVEVPPATEWLARLGGAHPRIFLDSDEVGKLRAERNGSGREAWRRLQQGADALLREPHAIDEPDYLPNRRLDYNAFVTAFGKYMWESRAFVGGAQTLAMAYLFSNDRSYARAACERMASISRWDPEGPTHLAHNDEPHMSVIWNGPAAVDWVWDEFTDEERKLVISQFRRRGEITFEHMHGKGSYGVTRFDSHAGREIVFLAMTAMVFHDHIPEAATWLDWLRPVLCGIWPVWAGDDGAWAEGPSYGMAYVNIMHIFATALKRGCGVDLYRRPFWRGHAEWRVWCMPPYAEWIGFGDHTERWQGSWRANAELVGTIVREAKADEFAGYVQQFLEEAESCPIRPERSFATLSPQSCLFPQTAASPPPISESMLKIFPTAGWAAIRTDLNGKEDDIALVFRSSPFGSISHSHAANNDFLIHVGGKILTMPSGYYDGYGSPHHASWVWHTKSHNCLTLSDAGQQMRSHASAGAVEHPHEDAEIVYFRGTADASYALQAQRCRRHVVFLKRHRVFVMIDEVLAQSGIFFAPQWNLHSWQRFDVDETARTFVIEREGRRLHGHVMYHPMGFFTITEGWQPPPRDKPGANQWHPQHHLRFSPSTPGSGANLAVVLAPEYGEIQPPRISTEMQGETEVAAIGDAQVVVATRGQTIQTDRGNALALLRLRDAAYAIDDQGISTI